MVSFVTLLTVPRRDSSVSREVLYKISSILHFTGPNGIGFSLVPNERITLENSILYRIFSFCRCKETLGIRISPLQN